MQNDKVDFDSYADNYNTLLHERTKFFSSSEAYFAKYKVGILQDRLREPPRRILEYGCGIGRNIRYLQGAYPSAEVVGTDISKASLDTARAENPGVRFEVEGPALELGQFDLIFVAGVFHHIPVADRATATRTIVERLSASGSVYVFEHNPFNPVTRRIVNTCPYDADAVLLRPSELRERLRQAGLRVDG